MRLRARAAGPEPTARRWIDRRGDVTLEDHALPRSLDERIRDWNRRKQRTRVRVARTPVELLTGRNLHDLAEVHDRNAVGDVLHDREFVGVAIDKTWVQTDYVEKLADPLSPGGAARQVMDVERLAHDVADRLPWIERRVRVLKDHRHIAAMSPQRRAALVGDVLALELDGAGRRVEQANDGAAQCRLAAARFADQAQRFALLDVEVDPVHRVHMSGGSLQDPGGHREPGLQPSH